MIIKLVRIFLKKFLDLLKENFPINIVQGIKFKVSL